MRLSVSNRSGDTQYASRIGIPTGTTCRVQNKVVLGTTKFWIHYVITRHLRSDIHNWIPESFTLLPTPEADWSFPGLTFWIQARETESNGDKHGSVTETDMRLINCINSKCVWMKKSLHFDGSFWLSFWLDFQIRIWSKFTWWPHYARGFCPLFPGASHLTSPGSTWYMVIKGSNLSFPLRGTNTEREKEPSKWNWTSIMSSYRTEAGRNCVLTECWRQSSYLHV